jgi:heptose-I-phosphate ethanolaminephosphotransferase
LFENSLTDSADNKYIVMHFYGSHISYNSRYKKEFSLFQGIPKGFEKHPKEIQRKVNEYANSIAFSDYVLSEIINKSKEKNKAICMVYMSDHGEYLADKLDKPYMGHGSNPPYKVEVEVPLIVWCSDKYKKRYAKKWQSIVNNRLAPINLQDMFYSLSDLMHIDYALMKPERSFFNEKYKPLLPRSVLSATSGKLFKYNDLKQ